MTDLREQVRRWLGAHWTPGTDPVAFREACLDDGWLVPTWRRECFGRGLPADEAEVVGEEFERAGAPGRADLTNLHAGVLYELAGPQLRDTYLRPVLTGVVRGCLLYSEPGAGSDLAGLRTTAVRDGDRWRVNGQKVWTSQAHEAAYGLLVARTDPTVLKHAGITFFVLPMDQPGVEVRPIVQITGDQHFNEVFLTDAWVDDTHRIGEVNAGWGVLMAALGLERTVMGSRAAGSRAADPRYVGTADDLIGLARRHGRLEDPLVADALAGVYADRTAIRCNQIRYVQEGRGSDPAATSLNKLAMSQLLHRTARVRADIVGAQGLLDDRGDPPSDAEVANFFTLDAYFTSIGGGTDQIQRNIVSERLLGLPKEADPSRSVPFDRVRR